MLYKGSLRIFQYVDSMNLKELWQEYIQTFIPVIIYVILVLALVLLNIINLNLDRDRALFQGLTAIGIALFVFNQFELDYRNRRRNVLYTEQIKAFLEFQSLMYDVFFTSK